ncbi:nucleotide-diphospho-sugar transferase [Gamsiella multidivaricata]|uniref:nucleotide-diphospho-sugar transferase n=1 Tax=Gamsiella multidivaricata TaxID=101098 RepID=UPI00221FD9D6|nr:nucleotide-diphospho-sugar transferase [Gamsiella multidivaricata]KAI7818253.1 nucleotide-diphospho-sugar transferase [Gamsiella multidivaricata]
MSTDQDPTSSDTTGGDSALQVKRANGVFVILTHEDELQKARETVRQIEDRFNRDRNYPWIVLTPLPLTTRSRNLISQLTKGTTTFGTIPHEQWRLPKWIEAAMVRNGDYAKMRLGMNKTSLLERHRWRYMSGFLAQHKLLDQYEFFWRVDPGVCILCDVEEDPMLMLKSSGQKFAWSLLSTVNEASVPGALSLIERFKSTHPELIPDSRDEAFLVREAGDAFTACTYGVETSIARVNFFRSPAYQAYFEYVDRQGPIYYHKWSDAAVTTIGLGLLAPRSDTLFLEHLGWSYGSIAYCPDRCPCNPQINNMALHLSCTPFWTELAESPELKRRLECNADGKCIMYVSKPNLTTVPDPK